MVKLTNVAKSYQALEQAGENVLKGINLEINKGDSIAVVGPSGSGKSTLLNLIGALDRPSCGTVRFNGRDLAELNDLELANIRNSKIGFVFQLHYLLPQCTVLENVLIPTLARKKTKSTEEAEQRAIKLLGRVNLENRSHRRPGELSGGERQRVAVARALINEPVLLLADEPTGSLDKETSENIAQLLAETNRKDGVTLVIVTHSTHLASYMAKTLELSNGLLKDARL